MKFLPMFEVNSIPVELLAKCQRGQWVYLGNKNDKLSRGRFYGVKKSGTVVVAWQGNAKSAENYNEYQQTLLNYAKGDIHKKVGKKACVVKSSSVQLNLF